ncbi:hypothetical protein Plec18167_008265 [Paecilomyces lecythidis]|uniref:Uncharacterized protein n=1 Tax=Paecilomyces lecythidis TaxID=3004212 RepID=A0ABR3WXY9_9EURO
MMLASFQAAAISAMKTLIQQRYFDDCLATTYSTSRVSIVGFAREMGAVRYVVEHSTTYAGHTWSRDHQ